MRALLTPFIQRELGLVFLKPGPDLMPYMSGRLLVASEPEEFKSLPPAGCLLSISNWLTIHACCHSLNMKGLSARLVARECLRHGSNG